MGMYGTYYSDIVNKPSSVYRLFDGNRNLLYVGISTNPTCRIYAHLRKPWGHQIAYQDIEWFDDREAAKTAERHAIATEDPVHNIMRPRTGVH